MSLRTWNGEHGDSPSYAPAPTNKEEDYGASLAHTDCHVYEECNAAVIAVVDCGKPSVCKMPTATAHYKNST